MIRSYAPIVAFMALSFGSFAAASAQTAQPEASPSAARPAAPTPTSTPRAGTPIPGIPRLTISGALRAYDFTRENRVQNAANPNRNAFNFGGNMHVDYDVGDTPFHIATTYFGAYPFGANGLDPQFNNLVDDTVPGFALSTVGELYARYKDKHVDTTLGDQVINTPWALASDSRIKPAIFQGIELNFNPIPNLTLGVDRMIAFQNRTSSTFTSNTLLTSRVAGGPNNTPHTTSGFLLADATYKFGKLGTISANNYDFYDIANLFYAEAKASFDPASPFEPTLGLQYVTEHQAGRALVGRIDNNTFGAQLGAKFSRNVGATLGFDYIPARYETVVATSAARAAAGVFLPTGGTSATSLLAPGAFRVAYGGIASPYTETYATDPLYTTSITQGMVDRHSTGSSYKAALTFVPDNKRVKGILSEAYYDYGNELGTNRTYETDVDVTYFVQPVPKKGIYHGLSLRERFADRQNLGIPFDFKYIRTQLEYDF